MDLEEILSRFPFLFIVIEEEKSYWSNSEMMEMTLDSPNEEAV